VDFTIGVGVMPLGGLSLGRPMVTPYIVAMDCGVVCYVHFVSSFWILHFISSFGFIFLHFTSSFWLFVLHFYI
jgi:hypothetical protein